MKCPLCNGESTYLRQLKSFFILRTLSEDFKRLAPSNMSIPDYEEYKCEECSLEFADPLLAGSNNFYDWRTNSGTYYTDNRWEFNVVHDILQNQLSLSIKGLDIGCGGGSFLRKIGGLQNVSIEGIDTTASAIHKCKNAGLEASCETIDEYIQRSKSKTCLDFITAFHCLEHVEDPLSFLTKTLSILRIGGAVFVSVPYSPTGLEMHFHDPLNHPPHHLTRWNYTSLKMLAEKTGAAIRFHAPKPQRAYRRALYALAYEFLPEHGVLHSRKSWLANALLHPFRFYRYWQVQRQREHVRGAVAPDVILCRFQKEHQ